MIIRFIKNITIALLFCLSFTACKEVYKPELHSPETGYLVVEGFINSGDDVTAITLSRTVKAEDVTSIVYEHGASVRVEGENNESFPLNESVNGVYSSAAPLHLNADEKYRLHINTTAGQEYVSDYTSVKYTPAIDSVTWQRDNGGVRIYANTHDQQNNSRYYLWKYVETWEFHARYLTFLQYEIDPATSNAIGVIPSNPSPDTTIYKCWKTVNSSSIIIGSSEKLSENKIYLPIKYIAPNTEELTVLYRMELKQYALSHSAYLFYQQIKKNTEELGTIFDPQPTELNSNIHCVTNPSEPVVGYMEVSQEQTKTLFIRNHEVEPWATPEACELVTVVNDPDSIAPYRYGYMPVQAVSYRGLSIASFSVTTPSCTDCRLRGTNVRPANWPQ